jgi:hypothetical protein
VRKFAALFSILLVLLAVNCFGTCLVAQAALPPCHQHQQNHPGQLAWSHLDFTVPVVDLPVFRLIVVPQLAVVTAPSVPHLVRPPLIALRI